MGRLSRRARKSHAPREKSRAEFGHRSGARRRRRRTDRRRRFEPGGGDRDGRASGTRRGRGGRARISRRTATSRRARPRETSRRRLADCPRYPSAKADSSRTTRTCREPLWARSTPRNSTTLRTRTSIRFVASAGRRPALNTPVDARSERALSERDAPLDQDAYDGERSVNAYGPSDDDDDFLQEFRDDEPKRRAPRRRYSAMRATTAPRAGTRATRALAETL